MFETWDHTKLQEPFVLSLVGGRKQGKSVSMTQLVLQTSEQFDLIISFCGNKFCQPALTAIMEKGFDDRFFFESWNANLIERLLNQQTRLLEEGNPRKVLIVMDDCVLTARDSEQLAHLAMRGRHFGLSLMTASVSYTAINKRVRRSLDYLFVFSCPMMGDMKVLSFEYTQSMNTAVFGLKNLEDHQCMVMETCKKQQILYTWKSVLITPEMIQSEPSLESARQRILPRYSKTRQRKTLSSCSPKKSRGAPSLSLEQNTPCGPLPADKSVSEDLPSSPLSNENLRI